MIFDIWADVREGFLNRLNPIDGGRYGFMMLALFIPRDVLGLRPNDEKLPPRSMAPPRLCRNSGLTTPA